MRPWIARLGLLATSLALSVLAMEGLLRVWDPSELAARERRHRLYTRSDPELGWVKTPGRKRHRTSEYDVTETINSRGIRGAEVPYAKPPGERRVLVLGDSFAHGYTVDFDDLCSEVLRRELRTAAGDAVEVINAGTGGYSTDQELLFFLRDGAAYEPDWTLLLFYYNDVFYNARSRYKGIYPKPSYRLAGGELVLTAPGEVPPRDIGAAASPGGFAGLKQWLSARSKLYPLARDHIKTIPAVAPALRSAGLLAPPRANAEWVFARDLHPEIQRAWRVTEALLAELDRAARESGGRLLVFFVPSEYRIHADRWERLRKARLWDAARWSPERPAEELAGICRRRRLDCVDPSETFLAESTKLAASGDVLYLERDGHWNAAGHRLAGKILARALVERGFVDRTR